MNILTALKNDHKELKQILSDIEGTTERAEKKRAQLFVKFKEEIVAHARAEEKAVYDELLEVLKKDDRDTILEGYEEHHVVDKWVPEIDKLSPTDEIWSAKCKVLKEMLEHHIKEEEEEIFAMIRENFDADALKTMADRFEAMKMQIKNKAVKAA